MTTAQPRWYHAATLVNTTLYITGGTGHDASGKNLILDETWTLDLSQPWSIGNPALTKTSKLLYPVSGHSLTRVQGTNQLLLAGGESSAPATVLPDSPILTLDTTSTTNTWSAPSISKNATATFHRLYHASLSTGRDGALLQGGYSSAPANLTVVSSLVTLKSANTFLPLSTAPVSLATNPPALARHTMTLTTDGQAVILGGVNSQGAVANLSIAYVMDTQANNAEWKPIPLSGTAPDPRASFSTVMVNATTMLVFGGTSDFKKALSSSFYLDLPSWTWSSPAAQGDAPDLFGHTAVMSGNSMVVAFGLSSQGVLPQNNIAVLDTSSNTWTKQFRPVGMVDPTPPSNGGKLSVGAVLGIALVITVAIVGGAFHLLVRRRKKRTRNTLARENQADQTPQSAIRRQASNSSQGVFSSISSLLGFGDTSSKGGRHGGRRTGDGTNGNSDMAMHSHPMMITSRMAQLGYSPVSLGYPETVVQHGCGQVPVASYIYPNQACVETEKEIQDGSETLVVYHMLTQAQHEALKLEHQQQQRQSLQAAANQKSKLFELDN
ncbi:Adagio protein 3 [Gryganskiella cystojenkinii]|nr:Adagio protein 3 [Gryganskiella cystojenkinii]